MEHWLLWTWARPGPPGEPIPGLFPQERISSQWDLRDLIPLLPSPAYPPQRAAIWVSRCPWPILPSGFLGI